MEGQMSSSYLWSNTTEHLIKAIIKKDIGTNNADSEAEAGVHFRIMETIYPDIEVER